MIRLNLINFREVIYLATVTIVEPKITPEENERNLDELKRVLKIIVAEWNEAQFKELDELNKVHLARKYKKPPN